MPDKMRRGLVFLCAAGLVSAQEPAKETEPVIGITTRVVLAPVTVVDRAGNFVPGLTPYDFRLYDNNKLQNITLDMATHPLSVVTVIQAYADVEKILPTIKRLSSIFESMVVGEEGEMAVIGFDHRIKVLTDFTSDPVKIDRAFQNLSVGGYTAALNDATMRAITMLGTRPFNRRRVVIFISENRDKGSEIKKVREVLTEAEFKNVVFYAIDISQLMSALTSQAQPNRPNTLPPGAEHLPMGGVNTLTTDTQMEMGNWVPALKDIFDAAKGIFVPDPLDIYTKYSGGRQYGFKKEKELQLAVQQIGDELHSQYLLSYSPNNQNEAGFHQIIVRVMKPDIKAVRVRDGYWLAAKPE